MRLLVVSLSKQTAVTRQCMVIKSYFIQNWTKSVK